MALRTTFRGRGTGACLLAALLLSACGDSADNSAPATGPQRLDVTARDFSLQIKGSPKLRPGPVTITARNIGKEDHGMVLVKLNDGVDTPQVVHALTASPGKLSGLFTYVGGTTTVPRGASWEATTSFDPGSYAMLDVGVARSGRLNFTRSGEVRGFTVAGKPVSAAAAARPTAQVSLFDYDIDMPKAIPPSGTIRVSNTGNDDHELVVLRVAGTAEARRIANAMRGGKAVHTKYRPAEVVAPTSAATGTTVRYALAKGTYIAYCQYATARSQGRRHSSLGMVKAFAVG
jgi:hypothetical protein